MIFLAFLAGFVACLLAGVVLKYLLPHESQERALVALEKGIRADVQGQVYALKGEVDARVLKLVEECNKSIATLQAQIASNPYYEYDPKAGQRVAGRPAVGMPELDKEMLEEYRMSGGAGGV